MSASRPIPAEVLAYYAEGEIVSVRWDDESVVVELEDCVVEHRPGREDRDGYLSRAADALDREAANAETAETERRADMIPEHSTPEWRRSFAREAARKRQRATVNTREEITTLLLTVQLPLETETADRA